METEELNKIADIESFVYNNAANICSDAKFNSINYVREYKRLELLKNSVDAKLKSGIDKNDSKLKDLCFNNFISDYNVNIQYNKRRQDILFNVVKSSKLYDIINSAKNIAIEKYLYSSRYSKLRDLNKEEYKLNKEAEQKLLLELIRTKDKEFDQYFKDAICNIVDNSTIYNFISRKATEMVTSYYRVEFDTRYNDMSALDISMNLKAYIRYLRNKMGRAKKEINITMLVLSSNKFFRDNKKKLKSLSAIDIKNFIDRILVLDKKESFADLVIKDKEIKFKPFESLGHLLIKYDFIKNDYITIGNKKLYRIKLMKNIGGFYIGTIGGYIESYNNLSQFGDAFVFNDAKVYDNAKIYGNARIGDNAVIHEDAIICDSAMVGGFCDISGKSLIRGETSVFCNVKITGNSFIDGDSDIYDLVKIDNCKISGIGKERCRICGNTIIKDSTISGHLSIKEAGHIATGTDICGYGIKIIKSFINTCKILGNNIDIKANTLVNRVIKSTNNI